MIPFSTPSVSPETDEEEDCFIELADINSLGGTGSSLIGWAIQLKKAWSRKEIEKMLKLIRAECKITGRLAQNWAKLLIPLIEVYKLLFYHDQSSF